MKPLYFLAFLLLLSACSLSYTFEDGFMEIKALDEKYSIDFSKEKLNGSMVKIENIAPLSRDLSNLKYEIAKKEQTNDTIALMKFIDARLSMLESEKYYVLGLSMGAKGFVFDTFSCSEKDAIEEATIYWNRSWHYAINATSMIDDILINQEYWQFIGINENKPEFYNSPLGYMAREVRRNKDSVKFYCNLDIRVD